MNPKALEMINAILQGLNAKNPQQVNSILDDANMGAGEKNAVKSILNKFTSQGLNGNDREATISLIEGLIQSAGDPAKKQAIYNTIVQMGLTRNLSPEDQQALDRILKVLK
ncbi:MAG: hypothetical protein M0Z31_12640 [Clostridia bacterium]|nr:hypothetical protein [Clostridia bacterium]